MAAQQRNLENLQIGSMLSAGIKTITAIGDETGVDFLGYDGDIVFRLNYTAAGSGATFDFRIEESDAAGSGYSAVTDGAFTQVGNTAGAQTLVLSKDDLKRYLRFSVTSDAGTGSSSVSCDFIGLKKYQ
jgi:hypothetical protein